MLDLSGRFTATPVLRVTAAVYFVLCVKELLKTSAVNGGTSAITAVTHTL